MIEMCNKRVAFVTESYDEQELLLLYSWAGGRWYMKTAFYSVGPDGIDVEPYTGRK
jgi:hypothetical protein